MTNHQARPHLEQIVSGQGRRLVARLAELVEDPRRFLDEFPVFITQLDKYAEDAAPALIEAADNPESAVRPMAAWFVVQFGAKRPALFGRRENMQRAADVLIAGLEGDFTSRLWSCMLLSQGEPIPGAARRLLELIEDPDERVQVLAATALSKIDAGHAILIQTLRRGLQSEYPALAAVAASAFASIGIRSLNPLEEIGSALERADEDCQYFILNSIGALGSTAIPVLPVLIRYVQDTARRPSLRGRAAVIAARVTNGAGLAEEPLAVAFVTESEPELVRGLIDALIELRHFPPAVIDRLIQSLTDPAEELRIIAATGLASVTPAPDRALPALIARIALEPNPRMVEALARAIGAARHAAVPRLVEVIKEHDIRKLPVVSASFVAMGYEGACLLATAIASDPDEWTRHVLIDIVRSLGPSAGAAVPVFANLLDEAEDEEWAVYLLSAIFVTGPAAIQALPAVLRRVQRGSDELSEWAEQVVRRVGPAATSLIESVLATADGVAEKRLRRLLESLRPSETPHFHALEAIDDDALLQRFVYIAEILLERGPTSFAEMEKALEEQKRLGAIERGCSTSTSYLRLAIQELEGLWNVRLTERKDGKKGGPTEELRRRLPEVKTYLQARADRRAAAEVR